MKSDWEPFKTNLESQCNFYTVNLWIIGPHGGSIESNRKQEFFLICSEANIVCIFLLFCFLCVRSVTFCQKGLKNINLLDRLQ